MTIRDFHETDLSAAAELEQRCFPDPWSQKGLRDTLREERACFLVAEDENGRLCGYLNATWVLDECSLNRICTNPDCRRNGVGAALLDALQNFCREHQIAFIFLEVRESNTAARNLYRKSAFLETGKRPHFYDNPDETAILMQWTAE